jgi:hypothetical protein
VCGQRRTVRAAPAHAHHIPVFVSAGACLYIFYFFLEKPLILNYKRNNTVRVYSIVILRFGYGGWWQTRERFAKFFLRRGGGPSRYRFSNAVTIIILHIAYFLFRTGSINTALGNANLKDPPLSLSPSLPGTAV